MTIHSASTPAITLRRATHADAMQLVEFYARHFADRPRLNDTALWTWEFAAQPSAAENFPFFVLDSGERIEGGIGYLRFDWHAGAQTIAGVRPVNYFVNPNYKGLHALRLFRTALSEAPLVLGSYVSDSAMPLVKRSGFSDLSRHYFAYHFSLRRAASATGKLRNAALVLSRRVWLAGVWAVARLRVPKIHYHSTDRLDLTWLENTKSWRLSNCGIVKDAAYLTWRYADSPVLNCHYIWQLRGDAPIALAILHLDPTRREAVLLDCLAVNDDFWRLAGLISRTMLHARRAGAQLWTTHALSTPLDRVLRALGCARRQSPFGLSVLCADERLRAQITDPRHWHFMVGDTDVY